MLDRHHGVQFSTNGKASAESAVQVVTRWILARLRHERFSTVAQVDVAIAGLLPSLNERPFQKLPGSRASVFGSALAGAGGAQLALAVGLFSAEMSAGRGYLALVAVVLAGWRPGRAALVALGIGVADALTVRLQLHAGAVPRELAQLLPYALTLALLAWRGAGRAPPAALGRGE